jgi:hypothetical protein
MTIRAVVQQTRQLTDLFLVIGVEFILVGFFQSPMLGSILFRSHEDVSTKGLTSLLYELFTHLNDSALSLSTPY